MTYGWMLLVVAVVGGAIFSVVQQQDLESVSGFTGGDMAVDQFGTTSNGNLQLSLRNTNSDEIEVKEISIKGESSEVLWTGNKQISVSETNTFTVGGVSEGDEASSIDVQIKYDRGGLSNLALDGTISGNFEISEPLEATGVVKDWEYDTGSAAVRSVFSRNGVVYIGGRSNHVRALDAEDGSEIWNYDTGTVVNSVFEKNGKVYAGNNGNTVWALDAEDGSEIWSHSFHNYGVRHVYAKNGYVYSNAGSYQGVDKVVKVDASDGSSVWNHTHHQNGGNAVYVHEGTVFSGDQGGTIVAADDSDGSEMWNHSRHSGFIGDLVAEGSNLYSVSSDNSVMSSDTSDGSENWVHNLHTNNVPGVDYGSQVVYSAGLDNRTIAVDSSDGSQLWNHTLHNDGVTDVYQRNNKVYSAGQDGKVIAANLKFD